MKDDIDKAFQRLQETLRESVQPKIKPGYKSARQIAQELNINYSTVRENLRAAKDKGLVPTETYMIDGHKTTFYKL